MQKMSYINHLYREEKILNSTVGVQGGNTLATRAIAPLVITAHI